MTGIYLRSALFFGSATMLTLIVAIAALPTLVLHRDATYRVGVFWSRGVTWLLKIICGLRHRVIGLERVPSATPVIFALKHQSAWETVAFIHIAPPLSGVLKRELERIPFYGWYLRRLGMVAIDRSAGGAALKAMVRRAAQEVGRGRSIMIMPEGTRMLPGASGRYHPGVAALYGMLRLPVVPVALNAGLFWDRRSFGIRPGLITLEFLAPIGPGLPRNQFMRILKERIEAATSRLCQIAD